MGYNPSLFWDSSLQEIYDLMESYERRQEIKSKEYETSLKARISLNAVLARQIGEYVAALFNDKAQITPLEVLFPDLFKVEVITNKENDMALYKAKMEDFAFRHNSKLKRKGE